MLRHIISTSALVVSLATACVHETVELPSHVHYDPPKLLLRADFPPQLTKDESLLSKSFKPERIQDWSYYYTHGDHIAGRGKYMAEWTAKKWSDSGIPSSLAEYEVYLNYPVHASLSLTRANGSTYKAQLIEDALKEDETTLDPNSIPAFHGYSASGNVTAEYVYVG